MVIDARPAGIIAVSSLSEIKAQRNASREGALRYLKEEYGQDFGYDQRAWLEYMLENDKAFVAELLENYIWFSHEPFVYEVLKADGRFDMTDVVRLEYPFGAYYDSGKLKPEYRDYKSDDSQ